VGEGSSGKSISCEATGGAACTGATSAARSTTRVGGRLVSSNGIVCGSYPGASTRTTWRLPRGNARANVPVPVTMPSISTAAVAGSTSNWTSNVPALGSTAALVNGTWDADGEAAVLRTTS